MTNRQRFFTSPAPSGGTYAPPTIGAPAYIVCIDRSVFKQTPEDKERALNAKIHHKELMRKAYGVNYKKHLNTPNNTIKPSIKIAF